MIVLKKEEEMELELGLSIGGGFKRSEKVNHIKRESVQIKSMNDQRASCFNTVLRDNDPKISTDLQLERMGVAPQVKRKKKRQKKQHHEGKTKSEECLNGGFGVTHDNRMWLKSPKLETRELEFDVNERERKKSTVEDNESRNNNVDITMKQVNLNFTVEQNINNMNQNVSSSSNPTAFSSPTVCPVLYTYPPIQFVQLPNGLPYPCVNVVPIWGNGVSKGSEQNSNVVESLVNQSFRPFQSGNSHLLAFNVGDGCVSDQNGRKAGSRGSPMGSPSIVSDYQNSSDEAGGSSETRSHSNSSLPDQRYPLHGSKVSDKKGQSEHIALSPSREAAKVNDETTNSTKLKNTSNDAQCSRTANCAPNCIEKKITSNNVQLSPTDKTMGGVSTAENQSPGVLKEFKRDIGKPPKPQIQNQTTISLPQMPCVSTTGNGPDGKTINGFLYRYSKLEVSIICVCHGTSFSPAEFVQHAGGRDVSNPLKHITVIPSAF